MDVHRYNLRGVALCETRGVGTWRTVVWISRQEGWSILSVELWIMGVRRIGWGILETTRLNYPPWNVFTRNLLFCVVSFEEIFYAVERMWLAILRYGGHGPRKAEACFSEYSCKVLEAKRIWKVVHENRVPPHGVDAPLPSTQDSQLFNVTVN